MCLERPPRGSYELCCFRGTLMSKPTSAGGDETSRVHVGRLPTGTRFFR